MILYQLRILQKENNLKYSLNEPKENSYYVTIDVLTKNEKIYNFEKKKNHKMNIQVL